MSWISLSTLARRLSVSLIVVGLVTFFALRVIPGNPTTVALGYLLVVLVMASTWGFVEACAASIAATFAFNFFFLPPVGTLTIADPQNWVALFSFLVTALIASRLSDQAKHQAREALARQQDIERLYTFSRAILLIGNTPPFPKQLAQKFADIFGVSAVVLYDRRSGEIFRAGPGDFDGLEDQLSQAALHGTSFTDPERQRVITAVRLGSEPIAALALQGAQMPDSVLQGVANLIAIGLERARAQDLSHQIEAARQSEQLRTTLIDAMAHEFKTPLTSIKAATTSLLANAEEPASYRTELIRIADEEASRLQDLIDNALEMARLDSARIDLRIEPSDLTQLVRELVASMHTEIDGRQVNVASPEHLPVMSLDRRLVKLALKQLIDNSLKYSPSTTPVVIHLTESDGRATVAVTDHGKGIPPAEQERLFERFYRSPSVQHQIPGSGLGLSIAHHIAQAHNGQLTVESRPGETTFRLILPVHHQGERI